MNQSCPPVSSKSPVIKFLCKGAYEVQHINSTLLGSVHKEKKKTINKSLFLSLKLSHTLKHK